MARKKRIVNNIIVTGIADRGKAVGRDSDGKVYFIDKAVPGDVIDVLVLRKKKSFFQGVVKNYQKLSEDRIQPNCDHFGVCGGCKWQNLDYQSQIKHKNQTVIDAMTRIAKLDPKVVLPLVPSKEIFHYRNKLEYSFSNKRWLTDEEVQSGAKIMQTPALGFHAPGSFDKVVNVKKCWLQDDFTNTLRNFIRDLAIKHQMSFYDSRTNQGFFRNMVFRNNLMGEWMVTVVFGREDKNLRELLLNTLKDNFPQIVSLHYIINLKKNDSLQDQEAILYHGQSYLIESLGHKKYKIGPKSFFQTNTTQAQILYDKVVEFSELLGNENVYDLYTGLGSIALYIADKCRQVVGIEEVEAAIADAKENAHLNQADNTIFYAGDVKNILSEAFANKHGKPDLVITDPPRSGMHPDVVKMLLELAAPKIVYVSCNPATQARDLALLAEKYEVRKVQPVDMFPHTHHVESVALLYHTSLC